MWPNRNHSSQAKRNWASRNSYELWKSLISPVEWTGHPKNHRLWPSEWKRNLPIHRRSKYSSWLRPNCWPYPSPGILGPNSLFGPQQWRIQTSWCMGPFLANKSYLWMCAPGSSLRWHQALPSLFEGLATPWWYYTLISMRVRCKWSNSHWQSTRSGSSNWHGLSVSMSRYWYSPDLFWYSSHL